MSKPVRMGTIISISVMIVLYLIGYLFEIKILMFKISASRTEIAFLPIAVGLLIAFISDRIMKHKAHRNAN